MGSAPRSVSRRGRDSRLSPLPRPSAVFQAQATGGLDGPRVGAAGTIPSEREPIRHDQGLGDRGVDKIRRVWLAANWAWVEFCPIGVGPDARAAPVTVSASPTGHGILPCRHRDPDTELALIFHSPATGTLHDPDQVIPVLSFILHSSAFSRSTLRPSPGPIEALRISQVKRLRVQESDGLLDPLTSHSEE
jgi:hypothetical protein